MISVNELERMWKPAVVALLVVLLGMYLEGLTNVTKTVNQESRCSGHVSNG
jgi:hypothetical protein